MKKTARIKVKQPYSLSWADIFAKNFEIYMLFFGDIAYYNFASTYFTKISK